MMVISAKDFEHKGKSSQIHIFDTGIVWEALTLDINSRGLTAHAIEGFDHEKVRKNLEISDGYEIHVMITIRREDFFEKIGFSKYVQNKSIERKMKEKISVSLILSKKEA